MARGQELEALREKARGYKMTESEIQAQRESLARGMMPFDRVHQPPRYDELPDPMLHPQEELSAGYGSLWFAVCAVIVCGAVVWWVLG